MECKVRGLVISRSHYRYGSKCILRISLMSHPVDSTIFVVDLAFTRVV